MTVKSDPRISASRLKATQESAQFYMKTNRPTQERRYDNFAECMKALKAKSDRASIGPLVMVPLRSNEDWFIGAIMGPEPGFARTGESYWECRGGTLRLWA